MANSFTLKGHTYHVGDRIQVHQKIEEEGKTRTQIFDGLVIGIKGRENGKTFTVRKISANNIGVERIFPVHSPFIQKIVLKSQGKVRRAKLNYLRDRTGRNALRVKEKTTSVTNNSSKNESKTTRTRSRKTGQKVSSK